MHSVADAADASAPPLESTTAEAVSKLKRDSIVNRYQKPHVTSQSLMDGLGVVFTRYDIPLGLLSKLVPLLEYHLVFLVDDSGSMATPDAVDLSHCPCTRWREAKERLVKLMDLLAYVPSLSVTVRFFNRHNTLRLSHTNTTPEAFLHEAMDQIEASFQSAPRGGTPTLRVLQETLKEAEEQEGNTSIYLLTDGVPDTGPEPVAALLLARNARKTPVTFISCSGCDADVEWMKTVEEQPMPDGGESYMAEVDDFATEQHEVMVAQGESLPYSYGFWLICQLVAAINPLDLDAVDEGAPLTRKTMNELLGHTLSAREYEDYFNLFLNNPLKTAQQNRESAELWNRHFSALNTKEASQVQALAEFRSIRQTPKKPWIVSDLTRSMIFNLLLAFFVYRCIGYYFNPRQ